MIAIWCQWKYKDYKNTKWKLVFQVFCSQKWSMVVATTLNLLLVVFAFNYGGELPLSKPALDWYDQRPNFWRRNRWFNTTIIRIFEAVMGVGFLWMIR